MHGANALDPNAEFRFAELLCSRLCHELVSPVSAINNGVELIRDLGADAGALDLIAFSGEQIASRLRALRLAYGAALESTPDAMGEARKVAFGYVAAGKASLHWPAVIAGRYGTPGLARLLLNLVMIISDALPRGGAIDVAELADEPGWVVTGRAGRLAIEEDLLATLRGETDTLALSPRTVHGQLSFWLALRSGIRIAARSDAEGLALYLIPMAK